MARNGNKPRRQVIKEPFTARLTGHPLVAYCLYEVQCSREPAADPCYALVNFVIDELLVAETLVVNPPDPFTTELIAIAEPTGVMVHDDNAVPTGKNVAIWKLKHVHGTQANADVAEAVWHLRNFLPGGAAPQMVAPNHILVSPVAMPHECPWGPPEEHDAEFVLPGRELPTVEVVVIDSGYASLGPITNLVPAPEFAEWLDHDGDKYTWAPGQEVPGGGNPTPVQRVDQNNDQKLDALAGHANFVAGVVARDSIRAHLTVVSHGSAFLDLDTSRNPMFVTEAAVARSLWKHVESAPVINVGFAFPTLPLAEPVEKVIPKDAVDAPPSWTLEAVLDSIKQRDQHLIVAPAGNHACCVAQYPAAFSLDYSNVISVGSISNGRTRSTFSDHGPWVACSTFGEDVVSAFVTDWDEMPTEQGEPDPNPRVTPDHWKHPNKSFHGSATWSGTSFAAPKVSARLASIIANDVAPMDAWRQLQATGSVAAAEDVGLLLDGLPQN